MKLYLFYEVCLCALSTHSRINLDPATDATREGASSCDNAQKEKLKYDLNITYSHKKYHRKKMIFSKIVDDCFLKDSAPDTYSYSSSDEHDGFEYKIKLTKVKEKKLPGVDYTNEIEKDNEFAFLDIEILYTINQNHLNKIMKNGKSVAINIGNSSKFNYLVVPIYLNPYSIFYYSGKISIRPFMDGLYGLFGDLIGDNFLKLDQRNYNIVLKFINEICNMSQSTFNSKFSDKKFLLANHNLETYKKVFESMKTIKSERDLKPTLFVGFVLDSLVLILKHLKLSRFYTKNASNREKLRWYHQDRGDTFTKSVGFGILTDIVNLLRLCRNPDYKFNFYENMVIYDDIIQMYAFVKVNIEFKDANQLEKDDIKIICKCKTSLAGFNFQKFDNKFQVSFLIVNVQQCSCEIEKICISIMKNSKIYETDWIQVDFEEKLDPFIKEI
ncbi:uncharacterized protein VNE69_01335 [Vairimorpha necatrix]|uniref:Uncharacterized protein n=1 Tax=Vairimorpha necatrix TaxID=6039 RepID=A0AAX4J943_9MICR